MVPDARSTFQESEVRRSPTTPFATRLRREPFTPAHPQRQLDTAVSPVFDEPIDPEEHNQNQMPEPETKTTSASLLERQLTRQPTPQVRVARASEDSAGGITPRTLEAEAGRLWLEGVATARAQLEALQSLQNQARDTIASTRGSQSAPAERRVRLPRSTAGLDPKRPIPTPAASRSARLAASRARANSKSLKPLTQKLDPTISVPRNFQSRTRDLGKHQVSVEEKPGTKMLRQNRGSGLAQTIATEKSVRNMLQGSRASNKSTAQWRPRAYPANMAEEQIGRLYVRGEIDSARAEDMIRQGAKMMSQAVQIEVPQQPGSAVAQTPSPPKQVVAVALDEKVVADVSVAVDAAIHPAVEKTTPGAAVVAEQPTHEQAALAFAGVPSGYVSENATRREEEQRAARVALARQVQMAGATTEMQQEEQGAAHVALASGVHMAATKQRAPVESVLEAAKTTTGAATTAATIRSKDIARLFTGQLVSAIDSLTGVDLAEWLAAPGGLTKDAQKAIAESNLTGKMLFTFAKKHVAWVAAPGPLSNSAKVGRMSVLLSVYGVTLSHHEEDTIMMRLGGAQQIELEPQPTFPFEDTVPDAQAKKFFGLSGRDLARMSTKGGLCRSLDDVLRTCKTKTRASHLCAGCHPYHVMALTSWKRRK